MPDLRSAHKEGFSFSKAPSEDVAKIWDSIWKTSDCYEVLALALMYFDDPKRKMELEGHWSMLKTWAARIDNWAHSDTLCGIYSRIHEARPKVVYATFKTWNRSLNPWLRRISIVSLFYYARQRKKVPSFDVVISLLKPQIDYDHYYVQKGVGWTLRECGKVYPKETLSFLNKNISQLSSTAFSTATEKISAGTKKNLLKSRKENRVLRG